MKTEKYIVKVLSMTPLTSKEGEPMVETIFKILTGKNKGHKLNLIHNLDSAGGICQNSWMLQDMNLKCIGNGKKRLFNTYSQYLDLILEAAEEIKQSNYEFLIEYASNQVTLVNLVDTKLFIN